MSWDYNIFSLYLLLFWGMMWSGCRPALVPVYPSTTWICILVPISILFNEFSQLLPFDLKHCPWVLSREYAPAMHTGAFFLDEFSFIYFFFLIATHTRLKMKATWPWAASGLFQQDPLFQGRGRSQGRVWKGWPLACMLLRKHQWGC